MWVRGTPPNEDNRRAMHQRNHLATLSVARVLGDSVNLVRNIEITRPNGAVQVRLPHLVDVYVASGASFSWRTKGFPYRLFYGKGPPSLGKAVPVHRPKGYPSFENRVPVPRQRGAIPSEKGHASHGDGYPSVGKFIPSIGKGPPLPSEKGCPSGGNCVPDHRKTVSSPSVSGSPSLGNGAPVLRQTCTRPTNWCPSVGKGVPDPR